MNDDWKWVLRTSNATRPVLRLLPGWKPDDNGAGAPRIERHLLRYAGLVQVSAGDGGRVTSFGNESDLGTAFALATSVLGKNQMQFSGNLGYAASPECPRPVSAPATAVARASEPGPEVTVTMRQMFVPGRVSAALRGRHGRRSGTADTVAERQGRRRRSPMRCVWNTASRSTR